MNFTANVIPYVQFCAGHVGAYLNQNKLVWFSNVYCIPFIAICGIFCNLLNITVLCCPAARRIPSCTYLFWLALCDCLFLVFGTLEVSPIHIDTLSQNPHFNKLYTENVVYVRLIASTCYKISVMLVLAFNMERYICVCHPLKAGDLCNKKTNRIVVAASLVIAILSSLQWPIAYKTDSCFNILTNYTYYFLKMSPDPAIKKYYKIADYLSMILFNIVPVVVLLILNSFLICTLKKVIHREFTFSNSLYEPHANGYTRRENKKYRKARAASLRSNRSANAILFAVVLMFMICLGPQIPARVLFEFYGPENNLVMSYMAVSQQLIFLNASLNFCLFCLVSRRYRNLMRRTLRKICAMMSLRLGYKKIRGGISGPKFRARKSAVGRQNFGNIYNDDYAGPIDDDDVIAETSRKKIDTSQLKKLLLENKGKNNNDYDLLHKFSASSQNLVAFREGEKNTVCVVETATV